MCLTNELFCPIRRYVNSEWSVLARERDTLGHFLIVLLVLPHSCEAELHISEDIGLCAMCCISVCVCVRAGIFNKAM